MKFTFAIKYILTFLICTYSIQLFSQTPPGFLGKKNVLELSASTTPLATAIGYRLSYERLYTNWFSIGGQFYFHHKKYKGESKLSNGIPQPNPDEIALLGKPYSIIYEIVDTAGDYRVVENNSSNARRYAAAAVFTLYDWRSGYQSPFGVYSSVFLGGSYTTIDFDFMNENYTFEKKKNTASLSCIDLGFSIGKRNILSRKMTLGFAFDYRQSFRLSNSLDKITVPQNIQLINGNVYSNLQDNSEKTISQISFRMIIGGIF